MVSRILVVPGILLLLQIIIQRSEFLEDNQMSQVESGFEKCLGLQFIRTNFLFIAILFVFFDVETLLLIVRVMRSTRFTFISQVIWLSVMAFVLLTLFIE